MLPSAIFILLKLHLKLNLYLLYTILYSISDSLYIAKDCPFAEVILLYKEIKNVMVSDGIRGNLQDRKKSSKAILSDLFEFWICYTWILSFRVHQSKSVKHVIVSNGSWVDLKGRKRFLKKNNFIFRYVILKRNL